jgi:hypothetical protein
LNPGPYHEAIPITSGVGVGWGVGAAGSWAGAVGCDVVEHAAKRAQIASSEVARKMARRFGVRCTRVDYIGERWERSARFGAEKNL